MNHYQNYLIFAVFLVLFISSGTSNAYTSNEAIESNSGYTFKFEVLVIDQKTNKPIPGVTVHVSNYSKTIHSNLGKNKRTGQTNRKGVVLFTGKAYSGNRPVSIAVSEVSCPGYKSPKRKSESCGGTVAGKFVPDTCRQMDMKHPENSCVIRLERQ